MIFVIMLIFFALIFPLIFEFNIYYDKNIKKLYLAIYFYGFIKIICGYFTLEKGYIAFHLKSKAYLIPPSTLINTGKKYKKIKHFEIFYIKSTLYFGQINDFTISFCFIYNYLMEKIGKSYKMYKNFALIKNDIIIEEEKQGVKCFLKFKIAFNMIVILIILFKKLMENIINAKKSRKHTKYN